MQLALLINEEGFANMTMEDVNELIDCHSKPLNEQDLEAMTKSTNEKEKKETQEQADETVEQSGWSLECLAKLFGQINKVKECPQEWDDDTVQSVQFCNKFDELMTPYKIILTGKRARDSNFT